MAAAVLKAKKGQTVTQGRGLAEVIGSQKQMIVNGSVPAKLRMYVIEL